MSRQPQRVRDHCQDSEEACATNQSAAAATGHAGVSVGQCHSSPAKPPEGSTERPCHRASPTSCGTFTLVPKPRIGPVVTLFCPVLIQYVVEVVSHTIVTNNLVLLALFPRASDIDRYNLLYRVFKNHTQKSKILSSTRIYIEQNWEKTQWLTMIKTSKMRRRSTSTFPFLNL